MQQTLKPLLLLEINEVPWRVVDRYKNDHRYPNIANFFRSSQTFTTEAVDSGELSPWITWPTFHRGVNSEIHNIRKLGQDPATFSGTPIWEEYRLRGYDIGVFGSMNSWPPTDPGSSGFFIPDTFAHTSSCIPAYIEPFQKFNLRMVSENGRVVNEKLNIGQELMGLIAALPKLGIRPKTFLSLISQLCAEKFDKKYLSRRPIFQSILCWDIFRSLYKPKSQPVFASFFTNHVAGVMHRYWDSIFPEDFPQHARVSDPGYLKTMEFAMKFLDEMLATAMDIQRASPNTVIAFATSMGQTAIIRKGHSGYEASIPDIERFASTFGVKRHDWEPLLAMVPQIALKITSHDVRQRFLRSLRSAKTESGFGLFEVEEQGSSVSITIRTPPVSDIEAATFSFQEDDPKQSHLISFSDAGIRMNQVSPGTAYHCKEGILALYGSGVQSSDLRSSIKATDAKALLMSMSGLQ